MQGPQGADKFTHLCMIDDSINQGELRHTIVVYRRHPTDEGGKSGNYILDHNWRNFRIDFYDARILETDQDGKRGNHDAGLPDTHDPLSSVDALISSLSTITIGGALHGKPVLCLLPEEDNFGNYARALLHFDEFFTEPDFLIARGESSPVPTIRSLLNKVGDDDFK